VFSKPTLVTDLEVLVLTPLQVAEGDNALVTTSNIDVVLDYAKFGVRDSGVLYHVIDQPHHGKLSVDVWERSATRLMFTMLDLAKDKVRHHKNIRRNVLGHVTTPPPHTHTHRY
jgi:chondroitin sulfate proteoglycan 4